MGLVMTVYYLRIPAALFYTLRPSKGFLNCEETLTKLAIRIETLNL